MSEGQIEPRVLGDDLFSASQTLSTSIKPLKPFFTAGIFAILAFSYPASQGSLPSVIDQNRVFALSIVGALFFGGNFKGLAAYSNGKPGDGEKFPTSIAEPLQAIQKLWSYLGSYIQVGFFIAIVFCSPLQYGSSIAFQPWLLCSLLALIAFFGFFAPTSKFYGPIRFGYLQYARYFVKIYKLLFNWWTYVAFLFMFHPVFFPFFGFSFLAVSVATWFYVYRRYRRQLDDISNRAVEIIARASLASTYAHEYVTLANKYEKQVLDIVAVTRRDALLAKSVKITDFFDCAARAWASLGRVTAPVEDVVRKANDVAQAAESVDDAEKPDGEEGRTQEITEYLLEQVNAVIAEAGEVVKQLRVAQEVVESSETARRQNAEVREQALTNVKQSLSAAKKFAERTGGSTKSLYSAAEGMENAKILAEKAKATAVEGETDSAQDLIAQANAVADGVVAAKDALYDTMNDAHTILFELLRRA